MLSLINDEYFFFLELMTITETGKVANWLKVESPRLVWAVFGPRNNDEKAGPTSHFIFFFFSSSFFLFPQRLTISNISPTCPLFPPRPPHPSLLHQIIQNTKQIFFFEIITIIIKVEITN